MKHTNSKRSVHGRYNWILIILFLFLLSPTLGEKSAHADVNLWPLLELSEDESTVLYPFYVKEDDFQMIFPFYYNTNEGRDHHFLWPLLKISDGRLTRLAPFYFREQEHTFTLLPLIRQTPDYTCWFLPPMYLRNDGTFSMVFPLYIKNQNKLFIFPNTYWEKQYGVTKHLNIFPLYQYKVKPNGKFQSFAYIAGSNRNLHASTSWFFPFYSRHKTSQNENLWLFPYYHSAGSGKSTSLLFPFYCKKQYQDGDSLLFLTYFRHMTEEKDQTALFPFFSFKDTFQRDGTKKRSEWVLWPIYSKKETISAHGDVAARKRRFLIFTDELHKNGSRSMSILGIPVHEDIG